MRTMLLVTAVLLAACSRAPVSAERSDAGAAALAEEPKPFGAPCVEGAECAGAVCFHRRARAKGENEERERRDAGTEVVERDGYCSIRCRDDADCPAPPTRGKCGARGMCKRPE
jgi:hypothetical protein